MNSSRKKFFRIDDNATSDEIFGILDDISSDRENDIDNLLEDSDTKFYVENEVPTLQDDDDRVHDILVPEANIHVVSNEDVLTTEESYVCVYCL